MEVSLETYRIKYKNGDTKYAEAWDAVDLLKFLGGANAVQENITSIFVWSVMDEWDEGRWSETDIVRHPELFTSRGEPKWLTEEECDQRH